jgi:hypothetical protein
MRKQNGYTLAESNNMIGELAKILDRYSHLAGTPAHDQLMKHVMKLGDKIDAERDSREGEAEAAYFRAHPELNP